MRFLTLALLLVLLPAAAGEAQHLEVGVAIPAARAAGAPDDWDAHLVPIVRLAPSRGWGVAAALNWFRAHPEGAGDRTLTVRPFMAGIGYTWVAPRAWTTVSMVAGPTWETLHTPARSDDAAALSFRPSVAVSIPLAPRVSATGSAGYLWTRSAFTRIADTAATDAWPIDAFVVSGGVVVRLF